MNFEDYLKDEHMKNYQGTDDGSPDAYEAWLENMDLDLLIAHADKFGALRAYDAVNAFGEKIQRIFKTQ